MTAEKYYETTLRALRLNWNSPFSIDTVLEDPALYLTSSFVTEGNQLLLELFLDASNKLEQQKSPKGSLPALKRILKDEISDRFTGIDTDGTDWYISSNSRAVRLTRKPDGIPLQPKDKAYAQSISSIMKTAAAKATTETERPSVISVKKHIADFNASNTKAKRKGFSDDYAYNLPGTSIWVNPEKLLDMLTLFPDCTVQISSPLAPVMFKSNDPDSLAAEGILMPLRHTEESSETESA